MEELETNEKSKAITATMEWCISCVVVKTWQTIFLLYVVAIKYK
jgi:hypothetical protein